MLRGFKGWNAAQIAQTNPEGSEEHQGGLLDEFLDF